MCKRSVKSKLEEYQSIIEELTGELISESAWANDYFKLAEQRQDIIDRQKTKIEILERLLKKRDEAIDTLIEANEELNAKLKLYVLEHGRL